MSNLIEKTYTTKLEAVSAKDDVLAILDAKLEATSGAGVVDYIGLATDHIEAKKEELSKHIKILQDMKKDEDARLTFIKEESAKWLEGNGIEKLDGLIVSSITINETKPKENLIVDDEEALINAGYFKTTVDTTKAKQALLSGVDVEGCHIEVVHDANKIKINKKRG